MQEENGLNQLLKMAMQSAKQGLMGVASNSFGPLVKGTMDTIAGYIPHEQPQVGLPRGYNEVSKQVADLYNKITGSNNGGTQASKPMRFSVPETAEAPLQPMGGYMQEGGLSAPDNINNKMLEAFELLKRRGSQ